MGMDQVSSTGRDGGDFVALATGLPQLVFGCQATGERTWPSPQWVIFTGLSAADSLGYGWLEAVHPDDRPATMEAWARASSAGEYVVEHRMHRASDGSYRWHQTRAAPLPEPLVMPGGPVNWVGGSVDVDDLYRLKQRLAEAEGQLRTLVEGVPQLLWRSCDMGDWTWASPQWLDFTGQTQERSHGRGWLDAVHPEDREVAMAAWAAARPQGELDVEFRVRRAADGRHLWHRTRSLPVRDARGRIVEWLGTTTDVHGLKELQKRQQVLLAELQYQARDLEGEIKERKQIEARLLHAALHDDLTGLRNRTFLMDRLRQTLDRQGHGAGGPCTVLFLDLDRFKLVNDSLGHQAGDLLLVEVSKRLRDCVNSKHTLARFGGDEFALLVEDADGLEVAVSLAERISGAMRRPVRLGQQDVFTSCSIGMVRAADGYATADEVMRDADIAMYHAKRRGGGHAVFSAAMRNAAIEALELRTELRNAIARDEFTLHYQPIFDIAADTVVGVEALIRWHHPRRGSVPPSAFISIAEESGLIREIGRWVLWEACSQLRTWYDSFPELNFYLNVNVSAVELRDPAYASDVSETLSATRLDPEKLQLEVTEGVFLHQHDVVGETLGSLRALGVRMALDDFGTGYSSLSYLDRYRVDTIKIDRSFVAGMESRPNAIAIVRAIVGLGREMGLGIVAEGVEDGVQLQAVREAGCDFVQGYLTGRPVTADGITALLTGRSAKSPAVRSE